MTDATENDRQKVSLKKAANCRQKIGERLAARRMALRMDQGQLAEAFEVSRQAISQYERGVTDINAGDLPFLAQVLGVPVLYFLADVVPMEEGLAEAISLLTPSERNLVQGIVALIYDKRREDEIRRNDIRRQEVAISSEDSGLREIDNPVADMLSPSGINFYPSDEAHDLYTSDDEYDRYTSDVEVGDRVHKQT